jgi:hypothetical protein
MIAGGTLEPRSPVPRHSALANSDDGLKLEDE